MSELIKWLFILALLFSACEQRGTIFVGPRNNHFELVEIDSCEYLIGTGHAYITHKGNCKYCEARKKCH